MLVTGWIIVVAAIALLHSGALAAFLLAGFAVEAWGLVQVVCSHLIPHEEKP